LQEYAYKKVPTGAPHTSPCGGVRVDTSRNERPVSG
jgi:hypothetical protein